MGAVPLNYFGRKPAWHGVGTIMDKDVTAREALTIVKGYEVYLEEVRTASGIVLPNRAILRKPTPEDPETRFFGLVGPEYELVTLEDAVAIWDEHVARPIESMGFIGKQGENFFCTTWLPSMDVRGEECRNYLLLNSPMDGFRSAQSIVSPVLTVCENTLRLAEQLALQRIKVVHDKDVKVRLAEWMSSMVEQAVDQTKVLQEVFTIFAKHKATSDDVEKVLTAAYPDPKPPIRNAPDEIMKSRWENYEYNKGLQEKARQQTVALFQGEQTGAELKSRKGTLWGVYNAVTERENYRRGGNEMSRAASVLGISGYRGWAMEQAFKAGLEIVGKN